MRTKFDIHVFVGMIVCLNICLFLISNVAAFGLPAMLCHEPLKNLHTETSGIWYTK